MKNITKDYGENRVLKGVDLKVKPGEIHALLGENGAGKSTLMNILFGMPVIHSTGGFQGEVLIDGKPMEAKTPQAAMKYGIGMVHQEFMLIPDFSIISNIKLNREILKDSLLSKVTKGDLLKTLDMDKMERDAKKALDTLEMDIDAYTKISGLPIGHMQFIEIAREIDKTGIKLLVFDEPTAVLTESEAHNLMKAMKKIAESGIAILFITHRLDEVISTADTITILRDGEFVESKPVSETNVGEIARLMVGRHVEISAKESSKQQSDKVIMSLSNFKVDMPAENVRGIDLDIMEGEIIGIGGLAGQGKIGIANGIMGLHHASGSVKINGEELKLNDANESISKGVAFVSEDRKGIGLLLDISIEDNIIATAMQAKGKFLKKYGFFTQKDKKATREHALKMIEELDIRCEGPRQHTKRLSGGNQQKVCLARALTLEPKVLLVSEPTRGIDIGAKKLVLDKLQELNREQNMTVVMTSSELAELRSICDRIVIIAEGKIAGILKPQDSDEDFGLMMSGDYDKVKGGTANG